MKKQVLSFFVVFCALIAVALVLIFVTGKPARNPAIIESAPPPSSVIIETPSPTIITPSPAPVTPETEPEPSPPVPPVMLEKYDSLHSQNNDLIGRITVPGTVIDYPVVHDMTNSYYLDHNFDGNKSAEGTIFLGKEADLLENNRSLSLFGHSMKNGSMFTALKNYKSLDYYKQWPYFEFNSLYEDGQYLIFSVFYMAGDATDKQFYYYLVAEFEDEDAFMTHVGQIKTRSIFDIPVDVAPDDQLVLLTVCTYETDDLRLVVAGRRLREDETVELDTSEAAPNPTPLYPQKWYNQFGGSPPPHGQTVR